jgi:hypothetical protein
MWYPLLPMGRNALLACCEINSMNAGKKMERDTGLKPCKPSAENDNNLK